MIPVVVVLWENVNFGGRKRLLVEDVPDLNLLGFDNKASAIGVHPGPDFDAWKRAHGGTPPIVVCYKDEDYRGDGLVLDQGGMNMLSDLFNDTISSVRINPPFLRDGRDATLVDLVDPGWLPPAFDAPITPIPLIVQLYSDIHFDGNYLTLVENSANLGADFGGEWSATASSVVVMAGPNFSGESAQLFPAEGFQGTPLVLAPGTYQDLTQPGFHFNDQARSIRVR